MPNSPATRTVAAFVALTCALSWPVALVAYLAHVPYGSALGIAIVALLYMPCPAFATLLLTRGRRDALQRYGVRLPRRSRLAPIVGTTIGFGLVLLAGTFAFIAGFGQLAPAFGRLDFTEPSFVAHVNAIADNIASAHITHAPLPMPSVFLAALVQGTVAGFTVNLPFALGEELGWRGLLLTETRHLGMLKSTLLIGAIWGIWHAPIIVQGQNYPGHPIAGALLMIAFTTALSVPLAYSRYISRSIIGAGALHGIVNGLAGLPTLFTAGGDPLFGSIAGLAGIAAATLLTIVICVADRPFLERYPEIDSSLGTA